MKKLVSLLVGVGLIDPPQPGSGLNDPPFVPSITPDPTKPTVSLYVGSMVDSLSLSPASTDDAGTVRGRIATVGENFILVVKFGTRKNVPPKAVMLTPATALINGVPFKAPVLGIGQISEDGFWIIGTGNTYMSMAEDMLCYAVFN